MSAQPVHGFPKTAPAEVEESSLHTARFVGFGDCHVDLKKGELFKDGARVKLQGKVYQALLALLQKPGEVVSREELRMRLWPNGTHVNFDANVNTTVNKLRHALRDSPESPTFVETIPRRGYSFVAKVLYAERLEELRLTPVPKPASQAPTQPEASKFAPLRDALLSRWFTAVVATVVIVSMLFGAAIALFAHR